MEFKLGELFCGPGGLAVGATRADISDPAWKITHQWATDYDEDTCNTYRQNICPRNPESVIHADIRELDYDRLKELGDIDGLAFGFPCNDFSRMGEHKGLDGDYGPLYTYGAKALKVFQPKWFLAENVGGIRSANEGNAFKQILQTFEAAGYNLVTNLYKFEQYGVPQARHRIIIVGIRKDQNVEFKVPSTEPYKNCDVSAKTALTQPPITNDMTGTELPQTTPTVQERLSYIKPGENVFNANMPEHLRLKVKGATISQLYKRLHPDKPSYTVIGAGGGYDLVASNESHYHSRGSGYYWMNRTKCPHCTIKTTEFNTPKHTLYYVEGVFGVALQHLTKHYWTRIDKIVASHTTSSSD